MQTKKIVLKNIFLLIFLFLFFSTSISALDNNLDINVFVSNTCPHCAELKEFLKSIENNYDYLNLNFYEVSSSENQELFYNLTQAHGFQPQAVPTTFIGDQYFVGYSSQMNSEIINLIEDAKIEAIDVNENTDNNSSQETIESSSQTFNIPLIGKVDSSAVSLPLLTIILGFLDGFNPCAFFVLLFLLSMLVYAKNKKRMLIIGLTFIFFSGLIYFLFMSAWLNFFKVTQNISIVTTIAGIIALVIAIINIKDFFAFKKGVTLSVSDDHRKNLIERMRNLLKAESMTSMMIGTIVLAITANIYELLCTAGFPMVFTKILVLNQLSNVSYYSYLLFYNLMYVLPLLVIVLIFTYTLGARKLSQSQGEALKLLSGMMMLSLGGMLVFSPGLLNNIFSAIGVIFLALILTGIIIFIKNKIKK
ncbi:MAG: glutaredoxin domain-containing protein [Candidatus ainarchaeum sp.]|jgi:glutaredoxin|nr:glutaredoxin domain-containing protein [Candidatus ainarchaeum sp.]